MSKRLGLPGEGQDSGREGEHTVRSGFNRCLRLLCRIILTLLVYKDMDENRFVYILSSVSTLCDNLRRERDRAVSDLADALRNLDDTRKQKNDAARELKELK